MNYLQTYEGFFKPKQVEKEEIIFEVGYIYYKKVTKPESDDEIEKLVHNIKMEKQNLLYLYYVSRYGEGDYETLNLKFIDLKTFKVFDWAWNFSKVKQFKVSIGSVFERETWIGNYLLEQPEVYPKIKKYISKPIKDQMFNYPALRHVLEGDKLGLL